jgi:hypothetical protein
MRKGIKTKTKGRRKLQAQKTARRRKKRENKDNKEERR